jgi:fibronectin-binding autotransporter adhesin
MQVRRYFSLTATHIETRPFPGVMLGICWEQPEQIPKSNPRGAVTNELGRIGMWSGSNGTVTVTGANSTWTNGNKLVVGYFGNGALVIENGGEVSNTDGYVGYTPGVSGTATVTGAGSNWINNGTLHVGEFGAGTLTIADGGAVTNTDGTIGHGATGPGSVTVTGANSTWTNVPPVNSIP